MGRGGQMQIHLEPDLVAMMEMAARNANCNPGDLIGPALRVYFGMAGVMNLLRPGMATLDELPRVAGPGPAPAEKPGPPDEETNLTAEERLAKNRELAMGGSNGEKGGP